MRRAAGPVRVLVESSWSLQSWPPIVQRGTGGQLVIASDAAVRRDRDTAGVVDAQGADVAGAVVDTLGGWYVWRQRWVLASRHVVAIAELHTAALALHLAGDVPVVLCMDSTVASDALRRWIEHHQLPRWWPPSGITLPEAPNPLVSRQVLWVGRGHPLVRAADLLATVALDRPECPAPAVFDVWTQASLRKADLTEGGTL